MYLSFKYFCTVRWIEPQFQFVKKAHSLNPRFRVLQKPDSDLHVSPSHGVLLHSVLHSLYCDGLPQLDLVLDGSILHRRTTLTRYHDDTHDRVPAWFQ